MNSDDIDLTIEILVLGQSAVGKTNLITRYVSDSFFENSRPTIGNDYFKVNKQYNGIKTFVKFWDTAGQERFNAMTNTFYFNADAIVLVYDMTNRESFERIAFWLAEVRIHCKKPVSIILMGNKNDLMDQRVVSTAEALEMAKSNEMLFFETSAKTNQDQCVTKAFQLLIEERIGKILATMASEKGVTVDTLRKEISEIHDKNLTPKKSGCC